VAELFRSRQLAGSSGITVEALYMCGRFAYPQTSVIGKIKSRLNLALRTRTPWDISHYLDPLILDY
jgi:hypothetical protein